MKSVGGLGIGARLARRVRRVVRLGGRRTRRKAVTCLAMILAPEADTRLEQGSPLHLQGQGYWLEEHRAELENLVWSSSLAGALGSGPNIDVAGLEAGKHEITLAAGEGDRVGTASIEIVVG